MFLEINNLKKSFGTGESRVEVLKGIQFSVEKGEICVLLGPSGSGKSTLLNIIGGIDEADSGSIVIEGEKIEDMNEKTLTRYRRKHLGYVFQMYNLIPNLTVKENIEVGAYLSDHPLDINDLLKTLGLYDHRNKLPNQLSGGQQQRTSIGRAIIKNPSILFCCKISVFHVVFFKAFIVSIQHALIRNEKTGHKANRRRHKQKNNEIFSNIVLQFPQQAFS